MIPILYERTETAFESEGLGRLTDAMRCEVTEERNGMYELEMDYPAEGLHFDLLAVERIIFATPAMNKQPQPFRIYDIRAKALGQVTVYARHVSYQLNAVPVAPFTASSIGEALTKVKQNAAGPCPFYFSADFSTSEGTITVKEPTPLRTVLGGEEGSILDTWHCEYEWDRWNVIAHKSRGADNGVFIRYGKNLTDIDSSSSAENRYTGVYCYYNKSENITVTDTGEEQEERTVVLPSGIYWTGAETADTMQRVLMVDKTKDFEELGYVPTGQQLYEAAQAYASEHEVGAIQVSIDVDFVDLSQTTEYQGRENLETVNLCDTVWVQYPALGINVQSKVVKTVYDTLRDKYDSVTVGTVKMGLAEAMMSMGGSFGSTGFFVDSVPTEGSLNPVASGAVHAEFAEVGLLIADKASIAQLEAIRADIVQLNAIKANITDLTAQTARIDDLEATRATVTDLGAQTARIDTLSSTKADITALNAQTARIDDLTANKADIDDLDAQIARINSLYADKADVTDLNAQIARINDLSANKADVSDLTAQVARIDSLSANKADVVDLNAVHESVDLLDADVANINTLLAGNAGTGTLSTIHLNAANTTMDVAMIRQLLAQNITVNDLRAGNINTDKFTVGSQDGAFVIDGSTQTIKDSNGNVRVQIGQDATGNFTFVLYDETGQGVLIDADGIKESAISDGLIKDSKIASDAGIQASKLDIGSLFSEINGSSQVIKSNRIWFDEQGQSLSQVYSSMSTDVTRAVNTANAASGVAQQALEVLSGISTLDAISATLTNDAHVVHTETDGTGGVYTDCWSRIHVYLGDSDVSDTEKVTYSVAVSSGVSGTWTAGTHTYQVTDLQTDNGYVDITAYYAGDPRPLVTRDGIRIVTRDGKYLSAKPVEAMLTKRFAISKSKDGRIGISYNLRADVDAIRVDEKTGTMSPASVTFSATYNDDLTITAYSGIYVIEETEDDSTYTERYRSAQAEASKTYSPTSTAVRSIRCSLLDEDGNVLDNHSVIVLADAAGLQEEISTIGETLITTNEHVADIQSSVNGLGISLRDLSTEVAGVSDGALLWQPSYTIADSSVTLNARLYKKAADVTLEYPASWYSWILRTEDGEELLGYGYSITFDRSRLGFGGVAVGRFSEHKYVGLATRDGKALVTRDGKQITASLVVA